jgi:hypothetical protein
LRIIAAILFSSERVGVFNNTQEIGDTGAVLFGLQLCHNSFP